MGEKDGDKLNISVMFHNPPDLPNNTNITVLASKFHMTFQDLDKEFCFFFPGLNR